MKKFTSSHEWIAIHGDIGTIGITKYAQQELGEIVYIELPQVGKHVTAGQEAAVLESTKAAADIYSPVSGEIISINDDLQQSVEPINTSPEEHGWLFKVKLSAPQETQHLLDEQSYQKLVS